MPSLSYKHGANPGDLIATLAGVRALGGPAMICQQLDVPAHYYNGAEHPTKTDGVPVMMNRAMWQRMVPLLMAQDYIGGTGVWHGDIVDYDIDVIRAKTFVNLPNGAIQRWPWYIWPEMTCDLSEPWIRV